jgi:hypothetical protein
MIRPARFPHTAAMTVLALALVTGPGSDRVLAADRAAVHKIGAVTRHARQYVGQKVTLTGYLLARETGYVLFSDEPTGKISAHDLPVSGVGLDQLQPMMKYVIEGTFLDHGLQANNGNLYHLELTASPVEAQIQP